MTRHRSEDHAVVLGGSITGLLAARVLADLFPRVTVVDRDELRPCTAPRHGVPQGRHIHAILARGQEVLEELFPGLTAQLAAAGAPVGDPLGDARLLLGGHRLARAATGLSVVSASRPLLEDRLRGRVRALAGVTFAPPSDAAGLLASSDRRSVAGVRLLPRADGSAEEILDADLVVDATGRGSRAGAWLEALGCERPHEERVRVDVAYATRRYRLPAGALGGDIAVIHGPTPELGRGGALAMLEGEVAILTLFGFLGDHPPTEPAGFEGFARSLPFPDIWDAVSDAEPVDDPVAFRIPADVRRRYERVTHLPERFLVMGDALCSFNPVYGQGMTVAALEALALRRHLRAGTHLRSRAVLRSFARALDDPWDLAVGADRSVPGADGPGSRSRRMLGRYMARLQRTAARDPGVARALVRVTGLVDRPQALLRPAVAARVLHP